MNKPDPSAGRPSFIVEPDKVGLGFCVIAAWPEGRRIAVTGFGDEAQAELWIIQDAESWAKNIPEEFSGEQWVNDRLPSKPA